MILQSLSGYYDRMAARGEAEPQGFSREKIGFVLVIDAAGGAVLVEDLRYHAAGKKPVPRALDVPAAQKRTVAVVPNFLWDKTAYALGVTAGEGRRTAQEHAAFRALHAELLAGAEDEGLAALRLFLETWRPETLATLPGYAPDLLDANLVFALDTDLRDGGGRRFVYERAAAQLLIEARGVVGDEGLCLVTGLVTPLARLHPAIKGVVGAQTAGAALVSFNASAYESWGKEQGANAPTGQVAAARYGTALNRLLDRGSLNRVQIVDHASLDPGRRRTAEVRHRQRFSIGDATTVFWADASGLSEALAAPDREQIAQYGEAVAAYVTSASFDEGGDPTLSEDAFYAERVRDALESLAAGRPAEIGALPVPPEVRINVLGLAPNAARLSVRFWMTQTLGRLAANALLHRDHCRIEPPPRDWGAEPPINLLLVRTTAALGKWDNIPPLLAGEVARAVLGGTPYPRTLLSNAIMRLRAGDDPASGWHAAAIRAVLERGGGGAPVSLNRDDLNPGYRLGRLFAVLEEAQERALKSVNATIRDRYFGAASATPATVFPLLLRGVQNHVAKLRKGDVKEQGAAVGLEREMQAIIDGLDSDLPRSLRLEEQGRFAIGYYHQRSDRFRKRDRRPGADDQGDATSE